MRVLLIIKILLLFAGVVSGQAPRIVSGPMLGYSEMTEVAIWLQCDVEAMVRIDYYPDSNPELLASVEGTSDPHSSNTLTFLLSGLREGCRYRYSIFINGNRQLADEELTFTTQSLWQHRSSAPDFTLAIGSCTYVNDPPMDRPGKPYGSEYEIFGSIADKSPYAMLWLGDNTYLREPDWNSRAGIYYRNSHTRALPEMQKLLRTSFNYAIWDDHDFGPNDSNRSFPNKAWTLEAFRDFWPSPSLTPAGLEGNIAQARLYDVDVFMLDNRWYRTDPDLATVKETVLGQAQIDWFIEALKFSSAKFKLVMIGGQFLSDFAAYENYARYEKERQEIIQKIELEGISGVVFLTGDRHSTELSSVVLNDGRLLLDLTCSSLTSGTYDHSKEPNTNRVDGTYYDGHNFGLLHFEGEKENRQLRMEICDKNGQTIWTRIYSIQDLDKKD